MTATSIIRRLTPSVSWLIVLLIVGSSAMAQQFTHAFGIGGPAVSRIDVAAFTLIENGNIVVLTSSKEAFTFDESQRQLPQGVPSSLRNALAGKQAPLVAVAPDGEWATFLPADRVLMKVKGDEEVARALPSELSRLSKNITAIAVDDDGFVYLLDAADRSVHVLDADLRYRTWVSPKHEPFDKVIDIAVNQANELHVLDRRGNVHVFAQTGARLRTHLALTSGGVSLTDPKSMVALSDGGYAIADGKTCSVVLFDAYGRKTGAFGSKGSGAPGTFQSIESISLAQGKTPRIAVSDPVSGGIQVFEASRAIGVVEAGQNRPAMLRQVSSQSVPMAAVNTPDGRWVTLPSDDRSAVSSFEADGTTPRFVISGVMRAAEDLACDASGNVYVIDRKARRVEVFSPQGAKTTHFGDAGKYKLKDPTGIAIQSDGTVVVLDRGRKTLSAWSSQGVFQRELIGAAKAGWKDPVRINVDSKDQIYVLDQSRAAVLRTGINGWPVALQTITVRSLKPGKKPGKISDFAIDRFDQLHVVNATTGQLEVFTWEGIEPELYFRYGLPVALPRGFKDATRLSLDSERFRLYFSNAASNASAVYDFVVKPPTPVDDYNFFIADGSLVVAFNRLDATFITGYGLLLTNQGVRDSLVTSTDESKFTIAPPETIPERPNRYRLVSLSRAVQSDPNEGFTDFYGHAIRLLEDGRYDEALPSFQSAIDRMGRSKSFREYVARRLSETGEFLALSGDVSRAMPYLRLAHTTAPELEETVAAYQVGYASYFRELLNREDIGGIIAESRRLISSSVMAPIVLASLDSVSAELERQQGELALTRSVLLKRKMVEWAPANANYRVDLGNALLKMYQYKKRAGATLPELESLLSESDRFIAQGVSELKRKGLPSLNAELSLLDVLLAQGRYDDAEAHIMESLSERTGESAKSMVVLKLKLCEVYEGRSQFALAAEAYASIVDSDPSNVRYRELYGKALARSGRHEDARQVFQRLLNLDRSNAQYVAEIGLIELDRENFIEASYQLDRALQLDRANGALHGPLAIALERSSNSSDAIGHYEAAVRYEHALLEAYRVRLADRQAVTESKERLKDYLETLARLYERVGRIKEVPDLWVELTNLDPDRARYHHALGKALLGQGLVYDAEKALYRAARIEPDNTEYSKAHESALKERSRLAGKLDPLTIVGLRVNDLFPSLYRNYADPLRLPIGELVIANNTDGIIALDELTVIVSGVTNEPTRVSTQNLVGFANTTIPLSLILPEAVLENTDTRTVQLTIKLSYKVGGTAMKLERAEPFTLHSRNAIHWGDKRRLASFVATGVEPIMEFNAAFEAALSDPDEFGLNEPLLQALRLYTALADLNLRYVPDPEFNYSVLSTGAGGLDYVRYPAETLVRRQGDCDDFVVLFAGLLENAGVQTAYVDVPGHVFLAVNTGLRPHELTAAGLSAREVIIDDGYGWVPIETTLVGDHDFMTAWKAGIDRFNSEVQKGHYPEIVSMAEARKTYAPASYVPSTFSAALQLSGKTASNYQKSLGQLRTVLRNEAVMGLESRYHREPGNVFVKNRYAILLAKNNEFDRAEGVLLEALDLSPENAVILNNLGNLAFLRNDFERAIRHYSEAFLIHGNDAEICLNLYASYLKTGNKVKAEEWLGKAIELEPTIKSKYGTF